MVTWLKWYLVLGCLNSALAQAIKTAEICTTATSSTVPIKCNGSSRIHVLGIRYETAEENCKSLGCVKLLETSSEGLITECNGVPSCEQTVGKYFLNKTCGEANAYFAIVSFECILVNDVNICGPITASSNVSTLYLASPNYPRYRGDNTIDAMCVCDVKGSNMTVELWEIFFRNLGGIKANLTLVGNTDVTWQSHSRYIAFNVVVMEGVHALTIMFDPYGKPSQDMWMKITGTSPLRVVCNGGTPTTPSSTFLSPTTTTEIITELPPATKQTTDDGVTSVSTTPVNTVTENAPSNTTAIIVGSLVAIVVVAVVVAIVVLFRRKIMGPSQESKKHLYGDSRRDKEDEAYEMPSFVLDVSDIKSSEQNRSQCDPPYVEIGTGIPVDLDTLLPYSEIQTKTRPPSPPYAEPISSVNRHMPFGPSHRLCNEQKPGSSVLPPYAEPIVLVQDNSDSANGPASPPYAEIRTFDSSRPVSSQYAEIDALNTSTTHVPSGNRDSSERDAKQTMLPNTSKQLEELYAKVIPKKFHSTKGVRREDRPLVDISQSGLGSTGEDAALDSRHEVDSKSRPLSNHDYQEIGEITGYNPERSPPPVPPKIEDILNEETGKIKDKISQKKTKHSKQIKASKILSEKSKNKDVAKPHTKDCHDEQSGVECSKGLHGHEHTTHTVPSTDAAVMVDKDIVGKTPANTNRPVPEPGSASLEQDEQARECEVHVRESEVRVRESEVRARESEVRARESEVRGRESEVHDRESETIARGQSIHLHPVPYEEMTLV